MLDDLERAENPDAARSASRAGGWAQRHKRELIAAAIVFQVLVLIAMIVLHAAPYAFGERILLRVRPVDPRDLFRGDYVVLAYDFSNVTPSAISGLPYQDPAYGDYFGPWMDDRTVYVTLEPDPDGKHYRPTAYSVERPSAGHYIKGRFDRGWGNANLRFGIEAFYVQEGQGRSLEQMRNSGNLSAEIALAPWGQAALCELK